MAEIDNNSKIFGEFLDGERIEINKKCIKPRVTEKTVKRFFEEYICYSSVSVYSKNGMELIARYRRNSTKQKTDE
jgi:hypothetical protein